MSQYLQTISHTIPKAWPASGLGPLQAVTWEQKLVLWKLRNNGPPGSSPTSHELEWYYRSAGVTWKLGSCAVLLPDHWDCLDSGWELQTKSNSYRTGKQVLSCTTLHFFFFLVFLRSSRQFWKLYYWSRRQEREGVQLFGEIHLPRYIWHVICCFNLKAKAEAMIPFDALLPSTKTILQGSQFPLLPDSGSFHPFLLLLYLPFTQPITKLSKNFYIRLKRKTVFVFCMCMWGLLKQKPLTRGPFTLC